MRFVFVVVAAVVGLWSCSPVSTCNATSCRTGCCDSAGKCQAPSNLQCGTSGAACVACTGAAQCFAGACSTLSGGGAGAAGAGTSGTGGGTAGTGGGTAMTSGGTAGTAGGSTGPGGGTAGTAGGTSGTGGGTSSGVDCTQVVQQLWGSGGCQLTLVSPANCATFNGTVLELAWQTNGTFCEGPHHLFLFGHPSSTWDSNGMDISLTSTNGNEVAIGSNGSAYAMTRNLGGYLKLQRADLAPLTSTNGQYHWAVTGFHAIDNGGSRSESRTFVVP